MGEGVRGAEWMEVAVGVWLISGSSGGEGAGGGRAAA